MALRCLWLARELPFPQDSGDRIHSARLALSLAEAGADVTFAGLYGGTPPEPEARPPVSWHGIGGGTVPTLRALASLQPLQAALRATPAYARTVRELLHERWDAIVLDHYGSSWLLPLVGQARGLRSPKPVLVHLSHNHEASLWRDMVARYRGSPLKRLALWQNMLKVARAERRLARGVDLLCCITPEDARRFAGQGVLTSPLVLSPGYSGTSAPERTVDATVPRRVILVGSFRWVAKQENLLALVEAADALFAQHGIALDIVGDMPPPLRRTLERCRSVHVHGFVDDLRPLFAQARMALVPEVIGGGFKLKLLDYVFHRVPVVALQDACAGLQPALAGAMLTCPDLPALVQSVLRHIDDLPRLDRLQAEAFEAARSAFDWRDRGRTLLAAMRRLQLASSRAAAARVTPLLPGQPHSSK